MSAAESRQTAVEEAAATAAESAQQSSGGAESGGESLPMAPLWRRALVALARVWRSVAEGGTPRSRSVASELQLHGAGETPEVSQLRFVEAVERARHERRLLVLYLHSPLHASTPAFSRALGSPRVRGLLNGRCLLLAHSVWSLDGRRLAASFNPPAFPYVAVLMCDRSETVFCGMHLGVDNPSEDALFDFLQAHVQTLDAHVTADLEDAAAADDERTLREQQDAAFEEAARIDRERTEARRRERELAELAERREREAALAARSAVEARERAERELRDSLLRQQAEARRLLPAEPAADDAAAAPLLLRLPDGRRLSRRWRRDTPLRFIQLLATAEGYPDPHYSLASPFPRRVFGAADMQRTLEELGLDRQASLLVQET